MSGKGSRPSLIRQSLWQSRRDHYIAVFENALMLLCQRPELPIDEPGLVRELRFTSVTARLKLDPKGRYGRPVFEAQNLPDPDSQCLESFECKRPDIQWIHDDESAVDDRHKEKSFVIECKRLGRTTASGWNLNEQYVIGGVSRFLSPEWKYGLHMSEGMMIGFIQDMAASEILTVLNEHLGKRSISILESEMPLSHNGLNRLFHEFERPFSKSPFTLLHHWVDISGVGVILPIKTTPKKK
ncbi:MAG: hypothetical protein KDM64_19400, partial [Verrucomicrobiae bacterium]|nr:hypothetical protein [Verrucomicrobiae bacterium]